MFSRAENHQNTPDQFTWYLSETGIEILGVIMHVHERERERGERERECS